MLPALPDVDVKPNSPSPVQSSAQTDDVNTFKAANNKKGADCFFNILILMIFIDQDVNPAVFQNILISRKERILAIEKRQPHGCGCRAYRDVFTATFQLRVSFLFVSVVYCFILRTKAAVHSQDALPVYAN